MGMKTSQRIKEKILNLEEIERIASQIRLEDDELLTHKSRQLNEDLFNFGELRKI